MDFVHLHVHSIGSNMDGLNKIEDIAQKAKDNGQTAIALTDHGNINHIVKFYNACKEKEIKPIVGVELYFVDNRLEKDKTNRHIVILAKNNIGLSNLYKIVSEANRTGFYYKPRIDWEVLEKYKEGLIVTTACQNGIVARYIMGDENDNKKAIQDLKRLKEMFGDDFYIELQYHNIDIECKNQKIHNDGDYYKLLLKIAQYLKIPYIITNDTHYTNAEDYIAHNIIVASAWGQRIKKPDDVRFTVIGEHIKTAQEMFDTMTPIFGEEVVKIAMANTKKIEEKCNVIIQHQQMNLPEFQKGLNANEYLRKITYENAKKKFGEIPVNIKSRIEEELALINSTGFANYFLILRDIIHNSGINFGNARGSAAGSIVSYLIGITKVDPIKYDLMFERFLNIGRAEIIEEQFSELI